MGMPEQLEVVAHGATVILATWLGLTVGLRAPRRGGARAFGVLAALLVIWSLSIIVRRLTTDPGVDEVARWFEVTGSSLLPPAVLTVATALTVERQTPRWLAISLVGFWVVSIAVAALTVVAPELEPRVAPPHLSFPGIPGEIVGWSWIAFRVAIFGAAIAWVALADPRRRAGSRSAAAAPGHVARARRRHGRRRAPDRASCSGQRPVDRRVDRHAISRAGLVRRLRAGHLLRARDRRARLPPLGAGRCGSHDLRRHPPRSGQRRPAGARDRPPDRHRPGAGGDGGRLRAGGGAGAAVAGRSATETRPTTGCSAPSARGC